MTKKDKLLNIAYFAIIIGIADVIIRKFIYLDILYVLNDFFWMISATILLLAISKHKVVCVIPLIIGVTDEFLQYFNLYPDFLDNIYTSTADIYDVIAYVLGFIVAIIIYKLTKENYE